MNVKARTFTFQNQLIMSEEAINEQEDLPTYLLRHIPLAEKVERANREDDRRGIDYWVTLQSGRVIGVDVKCRENDWQSRGCDDVALEIWSVVEKQVIGWTRNTQKQTDYVLFLWKDTGRFLLLDFPVLCSIFIQHWETWRRIYQTAYQRTSECPSRSGWHSQCVFVPRQVIWREIYLRFGGSLQSKRVSA